jgi:hypothetical protein
MVLLSNMVRRMTWFSSKSARKVVLALLMLAALFSVFRGVQNATYGSQDFQWTGARMLLDHIDPWRDALDGDPLHRILFTQNPNYLPLLYVLFAPLALLQRVPAQIVWAICNIAFAITSAYLAARFYGISRFGTAVAICLLLASTPFRMTVGNGQQGLFVLLCWSVGLLTLRLTNTRSAIAGVSYTKYNFAPPVLIYLWLRSGFRAVLVSLLPTAAGLLLVWLWLTGGHDLHTLGWLTIAPLKLAKTGYFPSGGGANLMDVLEFPIYRFTTISRSIVDPITLTIALAICFAVLSRVIRGRTPASIQCHMALLGVLSFGLFKHHTYDSAVLLFPICYLLRLRHHRTAQFALAMLAYIWYVERLVDKISLLVGDWTFIPQCLMLLTTAWLILKLHPEDVPLFPRWNAPETT